jgi:hypothetical protein
MSEQEKRAYSLMSVQILGFSRGQRLPDFREASFVLDRVLKMPFGAGIPSRDYNKDLSRGSLAHWRHHTAIVGDFKKESRTGSPMGNSAER